MSCFCQVKIKISTSEVVFVTKFEWKYIFFYNFTLTWHAGYWSVLHHCPESSVRVINLPLVAGIPAVRASSCGDAQLRQ